METTKENYELEREKIEEFYEEHREEIDQHQGKVAVLTKNDYKIANDYQEGMEIAKEYYDDDVNILFYKIGEEKKEPKSLGGRTTSTLNQSR